MRLVFIILILFFNTDLIAQKNSKTSRPIIFYNEKTGGLVFTGEMNEEVYSYMNELEIELYDSCLNMLGLNKDSIKWMSSELFYTLRSDKDYCSIKVVALRVPSRKYNVNNIPGRNRLLIPECILMINRFPGEFDEVSVQMFY